MVHHAEPWAFGIAGDLDSSSVEVADENVHHSDHGGSDLVIGRGHDLGLEVLLGSVGRDPDDDVIDF